MVLNMSRKVASHFLDRLLVLAEPGSCDILLIDVDSKDVSAGMSAPPEAFTETKFIVRFTFNEFDILATS